MILKFRAWDKHKKKMTYPDREDEDALYITLYLDGSIDTAQYGDFIKGFEYPKKSDIAILQFTGLQDSAGIDIYEGDIVNLDGTVFMVCFGEFDNGEDYEDNLAGIGWYLKYTKRDGNEDIWDILFLKDGSRIVGNKFENPELLGGDK